MHHTSKRRTATGRLSTLALAFALVAGMASVDRSSDEATPDDQTTAQTAVAELARMLAGLGDTDSGRAHARELLEAAQQEHAAP